MRFAGNSSNVSSYIQAGKAGAKGAADFFKVARASAPDYGGLAVANMKSRSDERKAATQAEAAVAKAGIEAKSKVKQTQIKVDAESKILDKKIDAKRKAGVVGMFGAVAGGAFMGVENNRAKKLQAERDAKDETRWQERLEVMKQNTNVDAEESEPFTFRDAPEPYKPGSSGDSGDSGSSNDSSGGSTPSPGGSLNFQSVKAMAEKSGAKYPGLVAAQWQLESGGGTSELATKHNNLFGQKGEGVNYNTQEDGAGGMSTVNDSFMQFDSQQGSVDYLVNKWYKDFKGYKGVNNAGSITEAAQMLKGEGYATDRNYVPKLTRILQEQGEL